MARHRKELRIIKIKYNEKSFLIKKKSAFMALQIKSHALNLNEIN